MDQYQLTRLKNGLRLMTVSRPQVESVTVLVGVGAGSRDETRRIRGLAHFLEHMAFKGTKKRPSTQAIATEVESVGGLFNAFTDKEFTGYWLKLAAKHRSLAFDILADMLTNSLFKNEEIERERGVIIEEINMRDDIPMSKAAVEFEQLLYGDNPMGWDTAGTKETVAKIKRADFLAYLKRLYYPKNMVLAVAGKISLREARKLAEEFFFSLRKNNQKTTKAIKIEQKQPRVKLIPKKTEQAHFCLGVPTFGLSHPDRWTLNVLMAVLGKGMSSRLFLAVRERRGLAYYVGTEGYFYTDSGYLLNRAGVKLKKTQEAIQVVLEEMKQLAARKVPLRELTKAKEMLKGNLILNLEDSRFLAERYALQLILEGKIRTPQETLALIDKVSAEDIQRVASALFRPEKLNLTLVGPFRQEKKWSRLLS